MVKINDLDKVEAIKKSDEPVGSKADTREIDNIAMEIWRLISDSYHKYGFRVPQLVVYMNELLYNHLESRNLSTGILEHIYLTKKHRYKTVYGVKLKVVESEDEDKYYYEVKVNE